MKPYNVEIFNRLFDLLGHTIVEDVNIDYDYLTPNASELTLRLGGFYELTFPEAIETEVDSGDYVGASGLGNNPGGTITTYTYNDIIGFMDEVSVGAYMRIHRDDVDIFGIITSITNDEDALLTKFGIQPFPAAIFSTEILFDTDVQGTVALETVIKNHIDANWVNNSDVLQNIPNLTVKTTSSTTNWGMNLKSDTEGMHHCIIDFYDVIIRRALEEYGIAIQVDVDYKNYGITLSVGKVLGTQTIEADLPNVFERTFLINESSKNTNKLDVYDTANYSTARTYYKHTDGTYSTTNNDRIYPVVREVDGAAAEEGGTFADAADSVAASVFGSTTYNNLIELTCLYDDSLINPRGLKTGSVVSVIHDGVAFASILTGYKLNDNVITLIFGSIRADLTKLIGGK